MPDDDNAKADESDSGNPPHVSVSADKPNPDSHRKQSTQPQKKWRSILFKSVIPDVKMRELAEALAATVAVIVCWIYWSQLQAMKGQLSEMQSGSTQTNLLIVNAAHQTAELHAMAAAATTSADAAKSAADTAASSLRPWLKITKVELDQGNDGIKTLMFHFGITTRLINPNLQVAVTAENVGHSVAQNVQIVPEFFFGKFSSDTWFNTLVEREQRSCGNVSYRHDASTVKVSRGSLEVE